MDADFAILVNIITIGGIGAILAGIVMSFTH
jgi:hypothetical protein